MRASAVVPAVAAVCLLASVARAQDKQTCNTAYQDAQVARDAHKLIRAREQLRVCASATCPGFITKDCTEWLKDLEPRVPSVVFTAKNAAGADVTDVKVSMDGAPLADKLDGIAVEVDPGSHTFVFEGADGKTEQKVLVPEGTKAQRIAITFGAAGAPAAIAVTPGTSVATTPAEPSGPSRFSQPVDNGLSFSFRTGYAIAAGTSANDVSLSSGVSGHVPIWFDVGYLFNPYFFLGAYFAYGVGTGVTIADTANNIADICSVATVGCSASNIRLGVEVQFRFLGKNKLQPWLGLGALGLESANESATFNGAAAGGSLTGIEWVNPQIGFDYKFLPFMSAGPFVGVSISEFLSASENAGGASESVTITSKGIHEWIYIGARVNFDLHI